MRTRAEATGRCGRYVAGMTSFQERARPAVAARGLRLPWSRGRIVRQDLVLAGVVLVLQLGLSAAAGHHHQSHTHVHGAEWLLLMIGPLALLGRRRSPVAVLWITFVVAMLGPTETRFAYFSLIVAFFLAAIDGHRQAAWTAIVVGYVSSLWLTPLMWRQSLASLDGALILGGWLAVLVVAAEVVRLRRERLAELRAARALEERRRASEERLLMARDLHDVIGHNISLINVQAAVGLDLMDTQPEQARAALGAIKAASKDALGELRTMLATLRQDGDAAPRAPAPGLERLGELIALTQAAGIRVTIKAPSPRAALPVPVDLAAYRIVQESLTNVARHAPGASVTVWIGYEPDALSVEIVDTGAAPGAVATGAAGATAGAGAGSSGTGIAGMRERALALGGELEAGPLPAGGFRVTARLPLEAGR